MKGKVKAGLGTLIGNAGEYYVVAELLKRNVIASLAPRNAPSFDVLATRGERTVRIRVKTKSEENPGWHFVAKRDGSIFKDLNNKNDFIVLVNLTRRTSDLAFYILPTVLVDRWLKEGFEQWLKTPGKKGQPHNPENRVRKLDLVKYEAELAVFRDNWDILWQEQVREAKDYE